MFDIWIMGYFIVGVYDIWIVGYFIIGIVFIFWFMFVGFVIFVFVIN